MNTQSTLHVLLIERDRALSRRLSTWLTQDRGLPGSGAAPLTVACAPDLAAARAYLTTQADAPQSGAPQSTAPQSIHVALLRVPENAPSNSAALEATVSTWQNFAAHIPLVGLVAGAVAAEQAEQADAWGLAALAAGMHDYLIVPSQIAPDLAPQNGGKQDPKGAAGDDLAQDARAAQRLLRRAHVRHARLPRGLMAGEITSEITSEIAGEVGPEAAPDARSHDPTHAATVEQLRASEARLRAVIESEPECVKLVSADGILLDMNPAGLRMVEADRGEDVLNRPVAHFLHPEDAKAFFSLHRKAVQGESDTLQFRIIGLKGTERWVETHSTPLRDHDDAIRGVLSVTRDITEQRQAQNMILRMAQAVSHPFGTDFLEELTRDAVAALGVKGAAIIQLDPDDPTLVETLTFIIDGESQEKVCYSVVDTPCAAVVRGESCVFARDVRAHFPKDTLLVNYDLEAYAGAPMISQQGDVMGLVGIFHDQPIQSPDVVLAATRIFAARAASGIQHEQMHAALRDSQRHLLRLLESVPQGIHGLDRTGRVIFENPAALTMLGWEAEEMLGRQSHDLIHHQYSDGRPYPVEACPIYKTLHDGVLRQADDEVFLRKDGSSFPVEYIAAPLLDEDGEIQGAVVSFTDITQSKRAEQLRTIEKEILELISAIAPLPKILERIVLGLEALCPDFVASIVLIDTEAGCLRHGAAPHLPDAYNRAIDGLAIGPKVGSCGTAAYRRQQVIVSDIATDPLWEEYRELAQEYGLAACWSTPVLDPAGQAVATYALYARTPRAPRPGELDLVAQISRWTGIAIARDRDHRALQASEERFRRVFQEAATSMAITAPNGHFLQANPAYCQMVGRSEAELRGMHFNEITHPDDRQANADRLEELHTGQHSSFVLEKRYIHKAGHTIWARLSVAALHDGAGELVGDVVVAENITERKAAEQSLRASEERFRILAKASNDAVYDWNLIGGVLWWNENFETLFGYRRDEMPDDITSWSDHVHPDEREQMIRRLDEVIEKQDSNWQIEYRFMRKDDSVAYVLDRGFVIRNADGEAVRMVGSIIDLTERKRLEEQIFRAQRLESLGTLAGGIAHDLNNVLTPILLSAYLLKRHITDEQARRQLEILEATAARGADMVQQVLTFARGSEGRRIPVDVNRVAQEVSKLMQDTLSRNINTLLTVHGTPWSVTGDPTQIHQVLVNLCVNARDAMPQGGRLHIEVDNLHLDEQYASMVPEAEPRPYVRITVSDTGTGIPKDVLDQIFDPFFTTKETGQGTGLGLSTVQGIARGHGGFITVYSEERRGTTFKIYLPAETDVAGTADVADVPAIPNGDNELILVVDDEESVRTMTQQTLEAFGYRVLLAEDGAQALSLYVKQRDEIDLVLTDMMMPIMDGFATIQALRKIAPELKIVAASGLAATGQVDKAARAGVEHFLHKPYTAESILSILAQALGKI